MKISEKFQTKKTLLSFEIFPPKKNGNLDTVWPTIEELAKTQPDYISVTYSAGGTGNKAFTGEIAVKLQNEYHIDAVPHLTCVSDSREQVRQRLKFLRANGVENIMALRGDIVPDMVPCTDFRYAADLVDFIRQEGGFDIAGACYPECHPECTSPEEDLRHLKEEVDRGVSHLVTQLFFENDDFYRFRENARKIGITVPIQAGIMPITNAGQIRRMVSMCGAGIPTRLSRLLTRYEGNPQAMRDAGIAYASQQISDLLSEDCDGIHIYSMNNAALARQIVGNVQSLFAHINQ